MFPYVNTTLLFKAATLNALSSIVMNKLLNFVLTEVQEERILLRLFRFKILQLSKLSVKYSKPFRFFSVERL